MVDDGRRRSSRIKKIVKEIRYDDRGGDIEEEEPVVKKKRISKSNNDVKVSKKLTEKNQSIDESNDLGEVVTADVEHEVKIGGENGIESVEKSVKSAAKRRKSVVNSMKSAEKSFESAEKGTESDERSDYAKVRATIRAFNSHYLHFVQEEELRVKNLEEELKNKKDDEKAGKRPSKRPDLKAISQMLDENTILYPDKRPGHLPGVDVGHQFYSRAEMCVVGLHNHWLNGIDFMGAKFKKVAEFKNYTFPVAISIVLSGQYEDDLDNSDDVIYTGQGGNDLLGNKSQIADQVMKRGNLALKNNIGQNVPVRVIRGLKCPSSYCGKVYTYDGLYNVVDYWAEKGVSGFTIYKYRLKRLEGQPVLTTNQVQFTRAQAPKCADDIRGLVCKDISGGQENIPIPATNLVDDPPGPPTGLTYITTAQVSASVRIPVNAFGCKCKGACIDPSICACAKLNGAEFPYVSKDGGRLIEAKDVVYECGPHCGCGPDCVNKTSQRGLKYRLEVYRTPKKGWGVRSWDFIPSGAFVCEYIGVIKTTNEVHDPENFFIFDIDCLQTMKGLDGRERRKGDVSISPGALSDKAADEVDYCIDAGLTGNVTRYINHSCAPNLFVQCVLSEHHDIKLARIVLFAADNIPPLQELSYDYGYAVDSVVDKEGNIKHMDCYCGAPDCKKRMF
ncbi:histone-lysine N-methyltransferase, H3 lysine-9 specific SUVH4-like [Papaver somniferum]|uniref:histone-lysine N-methyltransferase, H3 lysine-9 specific SUVH4-like n=1 Tax=Papaver somniferum TaxID=3469 RepID=UPI000E6F6503|nr:histone-lysine N-methyltransferase, H3 lysine-9 specific SUVH4-like [Papaver somniferum]